MSIINILTSALAWKFFLSQGLVVFNSDVTAVRRRRRPEKLIVSILFAVFLSRRCTRPDMIGL